MKESPTPRDRWLNTARRAMADGQPLPRAIEIADAARRVESALIAEARARFDFLGFPREKTQQESSE